MMEINDIKNIWKEQKAIDVQIRTSEHYSGLLDQIKKNEKKTKRTYVFMSIIMLLTIYVIDKTAIENIPGKTVLTWIGFGLIFTAIVGMIYVSWSTVIKFKINNVTESSMDFLKQAKEKMALRNKIRTIGIPIYITMLTAGISLVYIQITAPMKIELRVLTFTLLYLFLIIITWISVRKEKKKYLRKVKPIEDKIDEFLSME